jgi:hypothetical protein
MTQPTNLNSAPPTPPPNPPVEIPAFLASANKALKICVAILVGLCGLGALAIGITFTPFAPEAGAAALAASAGAFALSGWLFYSAFSGGNPSVPDLSDRTVTNHS